MAVIYSVVIFLAAALLFGVQPMVAKSLLPKFGGGSSVWTTCMLFFQTLLIAGYLYAHVLLTRLPKKGQMAVHAVVLSAALVVGWLFSTPAAPQNASAFPVPWLLGQLLLVAGLPYFAVSSAGPLIQGWFARTGHARAHDPYFLYAASNAGSFVGLLAYPFVVEPTMQIGNQRTLWLALFALFGLLALWCAGRTRNIRLDEFGERPDEPAPAAITWRRRIAWMFYAFVPSSMLLAVTMNLTTDIASFPLLWIVPLAIYLLTMIAAFSGKAAGIVRVCGLPLVLVVIAAWMLLVLGSSQSDPTLARGTMIIQLLLLTLTGLYGHARLALDRPPPARLTEFFLLMSVGGAMGGMFNGIVAPLLFDDLYEYHATLLAALLLLPVAARADGTGVMGYWLARLRLPALSLAAVVATGLLIPRLDDPTISLILILVPGATLVYLARRDNVACAGAMAFPLLAVVLFGSVGSQILLKERTFYGVNIVDVGEVAGKPVHRLTHGTTLHGMQVIDEDGRREPPLGYYHPQGPYAKTIGVVQAMRPGGARVCILGLGSGGTAAYTRPSDEFLFFEIDPVVEAIAEDTEYFTFLADARAINRRTEVRLGDGRLLLERSEEALEPKFDMIMPDAFSSDSIPTHLITSEAIGLYFQRLAPDGVVLMHISNRHVDLSGLLYQLGLMHDAIPLLYNDAVTEEVAEETGRLPSIFVSLTRSEETALRLIEAGYRPYEPKDRVRPWTDQYSNLLSVLRKL